MLKKTYLIVLFWILILSFIALAVKFNCYDDGSISIEDSTKQGRVKAQQKGTDDPYIEVPGKWISYEGEKKTYYNFLSEEAQFIVAKPTRFYVKIGSKSRRSVVCPAFKFSCKALNSTIDTCYKRNNTFFAKFLIYNIPLRSKKQAFRFGSPFSLKYSLHLPGSRAITHSPEGYSPEFKYINMTLKKIRKGNKYTLRVNGITQDIKRFSLSRECKRSIFYEGYICTDMPLCKYDRDCRGEEFCKDEFCEKLDCNECEYAEKHECVKYQCCEDYDCDDDELCEEHTCNKLECEENEVVVDHSCNLLDCSSDEITLNHECVKLECEEYEHAVDHKCELLRCNYDEHIVDHKCEKLECKRYHRAFDHDCLNPIAYIFAERDIFKRGD
ncbi:MAG: hypothetical protein U9O94_02745 [Nanoarchaeota archaeon]|nr:hypothetical protein [Nanoarchaeota archaeon]